MAEDILSRIKDQKLRELLNVYKTTNNEFGLIDIMDYFGMKFRVDAFEAIFPKFEIIGVTKDTATVLLGGFIIHSNLYTVSLDITNRELSLNLYKNEHIFIKRENKPKGDVNVK
jgi:hypothetical protein